MTVYHEQADLGVQCCHTFVTKYTNWAHSCVALSFSITEYRAHFWFEERNSSSSCLLMDGSLGKLNLPSTFIE